MENLSGSTAPLIRVVFLTDIPYKSQPIVVSEWVAMDDFTDEQVSEWLPKYIERLAEFASNPLCAGHCYIQLYDIENECNGYLYYDRQSKLTTQQQAPFVNRRRNFRTF